MTKNSHRRPQTSPKDLKPSAYLGRTKRKGKEEFRMRPAPLGGSCEGRKFPTPLEVSSPVERSYWTEGDYWSLRGRAATGLWKAKIESKPAQRVGTANPCSPTWRHSSVSESGAWVLKFRFQSSISGRGPG